MDTLPVGLGSKDEDRPGLHQRHENMPPASRPYSYIPQTGYGPLRRSKDY